MAWMRDWLEEKDNGSNSSRNKNKEKRIISLSCASSCCRPSFRYFLANKFVSHSCVHKFTQFSLSVKTNLAEVVERKLSELLSVAMLNQHSTQTTCLIIALIWLGKFVILQSLYAKFHLASLACCAFRGQVRRFMCRAFIMLYVLLHQKPLRSLSRDY